MILNKIAAAARNRVEQAQTEIPVTTIKATAFTLNCNTGFPFEKALNNPGVGMICEVKKASPSQGVIAPDYPYLQIAKEYEEAGAAAISVVTEPTFFLGNDHHLIEIQQRVSLPVLRKDFVVDSYQVYQAKTMGAAAVLLISALLDTSALREYVALCHQLGLSALVEVHDEREIESALTAGARIIGVNNRNLRDFTVDINNSINLRALVPENILFVAESGIKTAADIDKLGTFQVDGVLIGTTLMQSKNRKKMLAQLMGNRL